MLVCDAMTKDLTDHLRSVLDPQFYSPVERQRLAHLMACFARRPPPPDPDDHFPSYADLKQRFLSAAGQEDPEAIEESFLELYAHLHMHEAPYSAEERARVNETGGYWCHAGGISPILKAGDWIQSDTVSADLGAGNGLQGLLMQHLYPHRLTIQVEISRRMVAIGKRLQRWLEVPEDRVRWVVGDIEHASVSEIDFLYLYRPVRPEGPGHDIYQRLADEIAASQRRVVIFSIADCLRDFLPTSFETFYSDGHLTCFRKKPRSSGD